jgi:flagellar motor switch protein FliG
MNLNNRRIGAYLKGSGKATEPVPDPAPAEAPALIKVAKPASPVPAAPPVPVQRVPAKTGNGSVIRDPGNRPRKEDIAKYLVLIGKEEASNILRHLSQEEVESIAQEIARIQYISPDEAREVLERFHGLVKTGMRSAGGLDAARSLLVNAFGEEKGGQLLRQALPEVHEPFFAFLLDLEPVQVAALLRSESVAVKCIVLAYVPPQSAAAILKALPKDEQKQLILRLSKMQKVEREVLVRIEQALKERARDIGKTESADIDGSSNLAAIMRHLDPSLEQQLLGVLESEAPEVVETIRERLFTIDTLLLIEDRDLQKVLQTMENREVALILKGKTEEIRRKILTNVSDNRALQIGEDYQNLGPQPRREVDDATRAFITHLRQLEQDGKIVVRRDEDVYI